MHMHIHPVVSSWLIAKLEKEEREKIIIPMVNSLCSCTVFVIIIYCSSFGKVKIEHFVYEDIYMYYTVGVWGVGLVAPSVLVWTGAHEKKN